MNKKYILGLLPAMLMFASCDYNEDNFPGYDDNPITQVVTVDTVFTGSYPKGKEFFTDKQDMGRAVVSAINRMYPFADDGSSAKVTVKYGEVSKADFKKVETVDEYTLTDEDYTALETGRFKNFNDAQVAAEKLPLFCATKYADKEEGAIVWLNYLIRKNINSIYMQKKDGKWVPYNDAKPFYATYNYTLEEADYVSMGTGAGQPGEHKNFSSSIDPNFYLTKFVGVKYMYAQKGETATLTYKFFIPGNKNKNIPSKTENRSLSFMFDGQVWKLYNPFSGTMVVNDAVVDIAKENGKWSVKRILAGVEKLTMDTADYQFLINWVRDNKSAYLDAAHPETGEFYFGASSYHNNINQKVSYWKKVAANEMEGKTNDQIQEIMNTRLEEGLALLLSHKFSNPDPSVGYTVVFLVYGDELNGNCFMSYIYNAETAKFEKVDGPKAL